MYERERGRERERERGEGELERVNDVTETRERTRDKRFIEENWFVDFTRRRLKRSSKVRKLSKDSGSFLLLCQAYLLTHVTYSTI